jgi:hypothetical protein
VRFVARPSKDSPTVFNRLGVSQLSGKCDAALKEIENGKAQEPAIRQIEIERHHKFIRLLNRLDIDENNAGMPLPKAFTKPGLSVYAVGEDFNPIDVKELIRQNPEFVAAVEIPAQIFFEQEELKTLTIMHDPYKDPKENQHPNHVRIICTKGMTVAKLIHAACKLLDLN